jgi:hypothetical protein
MSHRVHVITAVAGALVLAASASHAGTITYDFSSVPQGTTVTPTTINGATFSSPSDPGAFTFGANGGLYSTLGSSVLSSAGVPATLDITFSAAQTGLSFDFAVGDFFAGTGGDSLTLTTNTGLHATALASIPTGSGDFFPQGSFNLTGAAAFTSVVITANDTNGVGDEPLVVADMTSTPSPVPLPGAALLLLSGLGGAAGVLHRRRATGIAV